LSIHTTTIQEIRPIVKVNAVVLICDALSESACRGVVSDPPAYMNPGGYEASYAA